MVGFIEGCLDILSMRHGLTLLFELFLFASIQLSSRELIKLELQEVDILTITFNVLS